MGFILSTALETVGKGQRERRKIIAGRKGVACVEVNEAEEQAKLMDKEWDKRMSLLKRKCSYSQNFLQKDIVPESQEPGQGEKLVPSEDETNEKMGKGGNKWVLVSFLFCYCDINFFCGLR